MVHGGISLPWDCVPQCSLPFDPPNSDTQKTQTVVIYNTRNDGADHGPLAPQLKHRKHRLKLLNIQFVPLLCVKNTLRKPFLTVLFSQSRRKRKNNYKEFATNHIWHKVRNYSRRLPFPFFPSTFGLGIPTCSHWGNHHDFPVMKPAQKGRWV